MLGGPETYGSGTVPRKSDSIRMLLVKLIIAEGGGSGGGGGGGANKEIFSGNGDPTGVIIPLVTDAIYWQNDSLPPGLIWRWSGAGPWVAPVP